MRPQPSGGRGIKRRLRIAAAAGLFAAGLVIWLLRERNPTTLVHKAVEGVGIFFARLREQGVAVVRLWIRDHTLRVIQGVSPADTSRIVPGLYVGGQHYRHGVGRMARLGIGATLSLRGETDDAALGVALERHLWLPTTDNTPPTVEQLHRAVGFVSQALEDGQGIYIHCKSGVGRAPATAAAYLVSTGLSPAEAWALIRRARPFIRPKAVQLRQIEWFYEGQRASDDTNSA